MTLPIEELKEHGVSEIVFDPAEDQTKIYQSGSVLVTNLPSDLFQLIDQEFRKEAKRTESRIVQLRI